ncbi:MAG: peptide chain release factor N(5)-glutamine methyltransferase [Bacillota bacterium]|jgi:release factor glutamine methyltransferase
MSETLSVREALAKGRDLLSDGGVEDPARDALLLLGSVTQADPYRLWVDGGWLSEPRLSHFWGVLEERAHRIPLQYLTGTQEFMSLAFRVDQRVLIPRPETEILVEEALRLAQFREGPVVVDVGTGSGAIAVSVAYYCPCARVYATDISLGALDVARNNAKAHGIDIVFLQGDLLAPVVLKADLILANLPYVATGDLEGIQPEVQYEPRLALDGGPDGLDLVRRLLDQAPGKIKTGGYLILEVAPGEAALAQDYLESTGEFQGVRVVNDYSHRPRVLVARRD